MHRSSRTAWAALAGLLGGAALGVTLAGPASAEEVYPRPADGVFALEGHGWGHGHGLSQWGAQGAASLGVDADTIVAAYYPGTARAVLPDSPVRVLLQGTGDRETTVLAAHGLTVTDVASGTTSALPDGPTRWRATVDAAGLHLDGLTGSTWTAYPLGGQQAVAGPLRFTQPDAGLVRVVFPGDSSRDYRGAIQAVALSATALATVDVLGLEDYLLGVVPRESSSSWRPAALQAQAIAARSYSAYKRAHAPDGSAWDICDSTQCQVFGGTRLYDSGGGSTPLEPASTTAAVRATAGVVRTYQGAPIFAEFSSSNGGWTADGGQPYLNAHRDDWDGAVDNPVHSWTAALPVADLESRYPALGHLLQLRVTRRDGNGEWGGRVERVVLEGTDSSGRATSVTASGGGVYLAHSWPGSSDGLRSNWWHIRPSVAASVAAQSAAPRLVLPPGASTGTLTVSMRNTGTTSWPVDGLHLAVSSPPGEPDPLVGNDPRPGHVVRDRTHPGASAVEPGDVVDLTFSLDASRSAAGLQGRTYRLRVGDGPLFGDPVSWVVPVEQPVFSAAPVGATDPTVVVPLRGTTTLPVRIRNTGNVTWPAGPSSPVRLGAGRPAGPPVAPGATTTFDVPLQGGNGPVGVTRETLEPVWQGRHRLDGAAVRVTEVRVDPGRSRVADVVVGPPSALSLTTAPTGTATVAVRLRNLGASAWPVGAERLRVSGPGWPAETSVLAADATRPGARQVLPGEVGEWRVLLSGAGRTAGRYGLSVQAVGGAGPYGPSLGTTVTVTRAVFSATLVAVSPAVTVPRAGTATAWFDLRNTGNVAWPAGPVRSVALTRGGSGSRAPGWMGPARPGPVTPPAGADAVQPGQVGRFALVLAGNGRHSGSYTEPFGLVWEGFAGSELRVAVGFTLR